jgi:aspartate carbamoyltransferase catalytic subunit
MVKHIVRAQQFDKQFIENIFAQIDRLRVDFDSSFLRSRIRQILLGRLMFCLFYEPSTRTRFSFSAAAHHLGMTTIHTENAKEFSSAIKGETLEDTIRVLNGYYPDAIVLRHFETGAAERAAEKSDVVVINAGDGTGQHPTQALLDLYTIQNELKRINGLVVMMGGDLARSRTVRSLVYLLGKYDHISTIFVSPPELAVGADIKQYLDRHAVSYIETDSAAKYIGEVDVVYWTRAQKERTLDGHEYFKELANYRIGPSEISRMKPESIILHPLPRAGEIDPAIDQDPRAAYFRQSDNGMFVRMALLKYLFS